MKQTTLLATNDDGSTNIFVSAPIKPAKIWVNTSEGPRKGEPFEIIGSEYELEYDEEIGKKAPYDMMLKRFRWDLKASDQDDKILESTFLKRENVISQDRIYYQNIGFQLRYNFNQLSALKKLHDQGVYTDIIVENHENSAFNIANPIEAFNAFSLINSDDESDTMFEFIFGLSEFGNLKKEVAMYFCEIYANSTVIEEVSLKNYPKVYIPMSNAIIERFKYMELLKNGEIKSKSYTEYLLRKHGVIESVELSPEETGIRLKSLIESGEINDSIVTFRIDNSTKEKWILGSARQERDDSQIWIKQIPSTHKINGKKIIVSTERFIDHNKFNGEMTRSELVGFFHIDMDEAINRDEGVIPLIVSKEEHEKFDRLYEGFLAELKVSDKKITFNNYLENTLP